MVRWHVISAVLTRNFKQYFTSVLGYLFIFVFVTVCAILTFSQQFFADNLANLDQLTKYFPALLLFFVPAITMSVWADEKKQGTDAILFTLPASDLEILLGKFLSVVAVYTVALLFSVTQLIALWRLGTPDLGVIFTSYVGYWLAGVALLAVGMFASSLTRSNTVAFVVGALLCAVPVLISFLFEGNPYLEYYGIGGQLRDFSIGIISLPGVVYFVSLTVFMLYLNLIVISKRHWSRGQQVTLGGHFALRVICLGIALISLNVMIELSSSVIPNRVDLTSESLYTLDQTTRETIENLIENDRPVTIQAFISQKVPQRYVSTKKQLIGLLHQYDRLGGKYIDVRFVDMSPTSDRIDEARSLGLESRATRDVVGGKIIEQDIFLGARLESTFGEVTLPFVDGDSSIEYQLTRSLATTTDDSKRLKIGVLQTDAHFDNLRVEGREYDWIASQTIKELEKQYQLERVTPLMLNEMVADPEPESAEDDASSTESANKEEETDSPELPDVMLVVDPSSLGTSAMTDLVKYIQAGHPTLILADPLPFFWMTYQAPIQLGIVNAPRQPRIGMQAPWSPIASSMEPKAYGGQATGLLDALGIQWEYDGIVWHLFDPHVGFKPKLPDRFGERWPDQYGPKDNMFVFVRSFGDYQAFNPESPISSGLQELMFVYPGTVAPAKDANTEFQPLVTLKNDTAGKLGWEEFSEAFIEERRVRNPLTGQVETQSEPRENFYTMQPLRVLKPNPTRRRDAAAHTIAAHIKGKGNDKTNVVFIADTDFITDMFFQQQEALDATLDNFTFFVNAIETLTGDTSFVRLRNRRATQRTLTRLETEIDSYRRVAAEKREAIEKEIQADADAAQAKLDEEVEKILGDEDMNILQKAQQSGWRQQAAERAFNRKKERLDEKLEQEIDKIQAEEQRSIRNRENLVRFLAIFWAGFPALVLGVAVFVTRTLSEQKQIEPGRRV